MVSSKNGFSSIVSQRRTLCIYLHTKLERLYQNPFGKIKHIENCPTFESFLSYLYLTNITFKPTFELFLNLHLSYLFQVAILIWNPFNTNICVISQLVVSFPSIGSIGNSTIDRNRTLVTSQITSVKHKNEDLAQYQQMQEKVKQCKKIS